TREDMKAAGYSPSVRLFEAAACGVPIVSDPFPGLETIFRIGQEILVARSPSDVVALLETTAPEKRDRIAAAARAAVLARHTCDHRAAELETLLREAARNRFRHWQRGGPRHRAATTEAGVAHG
ncbi:MAG: glycosyltransferase, partial [Alphaproteobacteria bacterium]|nr:glycosyltransferase [Alphaproteobacteria bacterium]